MLLRAVGTSTGASDRGPQPAADPQPVAAKRHEVDIVPCSRRCRPCRVLRPHACWHAMCSSFGANGIDRHTKHVPCKAVDRIAVCAATNRSSAQHAGRNQRHRRKRQGLPRARDRRPPASNGDSPSPSSMLDGWFRLPARKIQLRRGLPSTFTRTHFVLRTCSRQLVVPLRERRRVSVEADFAEETATTYRRMHYEFADIDIILLEGIYLLKLEYRDHYDVSIWIDCSFDTALKRAVARAQEGLTAGGNRSAPIGPFTFPRRNCTFDAIPHVKRRC